MFGPCFVVQYFVSFGFCKYLDGEARACWFTFTVFLMSCDGQCSIAWPKCVVCRFVVLDLVFPDLLNYAN